ncbi:hypothetical protein LOK49_LG05G03046 [Camellia lanceoleosa]|uniref:Uncharacterized protein n=1 Tax=Camellia lanceoleosa TaxID=1840588 RepID=A0ACC0HQM4_9ERIC|nr:hypothetical protein LOK49_LG05G03046 [Camellia lanceoleosa]
MSMEVYKRANVQEMLSPLLSLLLLLSSLKEWLEATWRRQRAVEVLELLHDTFHVVSKVEKLIKELPSMLADLSNGDLNFAEKDRLSNGISFQHIANGTNPVEAQSMLLERIASEMNRLKFYITHACVYLLCHPHVNSISFLVVFTFVF